MLNREPQTVFIRLRVLAALLLASIAWGSTVEFTHHHGSRNSKSGSASEVATQTDNQPGEARVQNSDTQKSSSRSNTGAECSICQLHHNLATTLLNAGALGAADETYVAHSPASVRVQFLQFTATLHGRAPPVSFLS